MRVSLTRPGLLPTPLGVFIETTVGLGACSLLLGIAAHARINTPIAYLGLSVTAIALGRRHLVAAWRRFVMAAEGHRLDEPPVLLCALLWFAFGMQLCFAALPERYFDALAMHLVVPHALQMFRSWHFDAREYVWAVQPMGANWLFGWAYVLAGEYAAKLLNAAFLLLMCGVLVEARLMSRHATLLAVAILALMPLTFVETASLFVENAVALFVVASVVLAARLSDVPRRKPLPRSRSFPARRSASSCTA